MLARLLVALVVRAVARLLASERGQVNAVATACAGGASGDGVHAVALVNDLVAVVPVEGEAAKLAGGWWRWCAGILRDGHEVPFVVLALGSCEDSAGAVSLSDTGIVSYSY
jgi:homoserine acetyltransferase